MKATVRVVERHVLNVTAFEKGDEPADAIDLPSALINRWQAAKLELARAENEVRQVANAAGVNTVEPW